MIAIEQDSRLGLPSASGIQSLAACPGKWRAELGLPEIETGDGYADTGDRVHRALAGEIVELNEEEIETKEQCEAAADFIAIAKGFGDAEIIREERYWLYGTGPDGKFGKIFSGKLDELRIIGKRALFNDFKTLWGYHADAHRNLQLRSYVVLATQDHEIESAEVALIQPKKRREPMVCSYEAADIRHSERELRVILAAAFAPNPPRVAGPQCKFCRARLVCPQSTGAVKSLASVGSMLEKINEMGPADLARLLDLKVPALAVLKAAEAKAFELLAKDPDALRPFGFIEGETVPKRSVEKVGELFSRMNEKYGTTPEEFADICGVTITDTKKLVGKEMKRLGIKPERGSGGIARIINDLLDGLTVKGKPGRKLVRVGDAIEEEGEE